MISSMEWIINFKILMVNLLALSCVYSDNNIVYYVRPHNVDCPASGYECDILNNLGTDDLGLPEYNTVIMILIEGSHTTDGNVYFWMSCESLYSTHHW